MTISIAVLANYGFSKKRMDQLAASNLSIIDLVYPTKKAIEYSGLGGTPSTLNKAISVVLQHDIPLSMDVFDTVHLLQWVGLPIAKVKLLQVHGLTSIQHLRQLSVSAFNAAIPNAKSTLYRLIQTKLRALDELMSDNIQEQIAVYSVAQLRERKAIYRVDFVHHLLEVFPTVDEPIVSSVIDSLVSNLVIRVENTIVLLTEKLALDTVLDLNFEHKAMVMDRFTGATLEDVGSHYNLTRERVRQIVAKSIAQFPELVEDRYREMYESYDMSEAMFCAVFDEPSVTYYYLREKYKKGTVDALGLLESSLSNRKKLTVIEHVSLSLSDEAIEKVRVYLVHHMVSQEDERFILTKFNLLKKRNGTIVRRTAAVIFDEVLFIVGADYLTDEDIEPHYIAYCQSIGDTRFVNAVVRGLSDRSVASIRTIRGKYRYYNYEAIDDMAIQNLADMFEVTPGIYGVERMYQDNRPLMQSLDLRDGYELAYLCNTLGLHHFPLVTKINRLSEFQIGVASKDDFLSELMDLYNGQSVDVLLDHLHQTYGLHSISYLSLIGSDYKEFVHNNMIYLDPVLPESATFYKELNARLTEDIYTVDQVKQVIETFDTSKEWVVSNALLSQSAYKQVNNLVFRKEYSGSFEAYSAVLMKDDFFVPSDNPIFMHSTYFFVLRQLEMEFKLFRYAPGKFINSRVLEANGVNSNAIDQFVCRVEEASMDYEYFSYHHLVRHGFEDPLMDLGFDDIFYEGIISATGRFDYVLSLVKLFGSHSTKQVSIKGFLYSVLVKEGTIDSDEFQDVLKKEYNFTMPKTKIVAVLTDKGVYYSPIIDRLYVTKEDYLMEVYGE